jgi:hypothetical protein
MVLYPQMMEITHSDLLLLVEAEIDSYVAPEHHSEAMGSALPSSWFSDRLAEMRAVLVPPLAAKIRDLDEETGQLVIVDVVIVADDEEGTIVAYDPKADSFVLVARDPDRDQIRAVDYVSCGVRGSAVDCFLAA